MTADAADDGTAPFLAPGPAVTPELFRDWRSPRVGTTNPERMTNPVWDWLVRSGISAYAASRYFGVGDVCPSAPGWSFARFGQSSTMLDDGREVRIAGEHEDSYDPDFYIYNDVVVRHPDGRIEISGYPRDVFPPTDFHTATLAGDRIVIIGSLGYPADRAIGATQVAILDLATFSIATIATSGDRPGWIHAHSAALVDGGAGIVIGGGKVERGRGAGLDFVENGDDWRLDLAAWRWDRLTNRGWRQWQLSREDRTRNHLWRLRSLLQFRGVRWAKEHRESMEAMIAQESAQVAAAYGRAPDLDAFASLFTPPVAHESLPDAADESGVRRIRVDGVIVRYVDRTFAVKLIVEGVLRDDTCAALVGDLREKLSALEGAAYVAMEL